jgi:hypothetical protein
MMDHDSLINRKRERRGKKGGKMVLSLGDGKDPWVYILCEKPNQVDNFKCTRSNGALIFRQGWGRPHH